jgi:hypothetical protein
MPATADLKQSPVSWLPQAEIRCTPGKIKHGLQILHQERKRAFQVRKTLGAGAGGAADPELAFPESGVPLIADTRALHESGF